MLVINEESHPNDFCFNCNNFNGDIESVTLIDDFNVEKTIKVNRTIQKCLSGLVSNKLMEEVLYELSHVKNRKTHEEYTSLFSLIVTTSRLYWTSLNTDCIKEVGAEHGECDTYRCHTLIKHTPGYTVFFYRDGVVSIIPKDKPKTITRYLCHGLFEYLIRYETMSSEVFFTNTLRAEYLHMCISDADDFSVKIVHSTHEEYPNCSVRVNITHNDENSTVRFTSDGVYGKALDYLAMAKLAKDKDFPSSKRIKTSFEKLCAFHNYSALGQKPNESIKLFRETMCIDPMDTASLKAHQMVAAGVSSYQTLDVQKSEYLATCMQICSSVYGSEKQYGHSLAAYCAAMLSYKGYPAPVEYLVSKGPGGMRVTNTNTKYTLYVNFIDSIMQATK